MQVVNRAWGCTLVPGVHMNVEQRVEKVELQSDIEPWTRRRHT